MPIYCFRCDRCGRPVERFTASAAAGAPPGGSCDCGGPLSRCYADEVAPGRHGELAEMTVLAAGVMPAQAAAAEAGFAARGIDGVRFDRRTGDAVFSSRSARLKALNAMGLHDKNEIRG